MNKKDWEVRAVISVMAVALLICVITIPLIIFAKGRLNEKPAPAINNRVFSINLNTNKIYEHNVDTM